MKKYLSRFLVGLLGIICIFLADLLVAAFVTTIAAGLFWVFTMGKALPREAGIWIFLITLILPAIPVIYLIGAAMQKSVRKEDKDG